MNIRRYRYHLFLLLATFIFCYKVQGQDLFFNKGVSVFIDSGALIHFKGDVSLMNDSIIENNGVIELAGDLKSGMYKPFYSKEIVFTGNKSQLIECDSILHFEKIIINKDSNGLHLATTIKVLHTLDLNNGFLDIGDHDLLLDSTGVIANENATNFITGNTGKIIAFQYLNAPNSVNIGNIGAAITTTSNLGLTTIERSHYANNIAIGNSVFRNFNIIPENNTFTNASVQFFLFNDSPELYDFIPLLNLGIFTLGQNWDEINSSISTDSSSITISNLSSFGYYTFYLSGSLLPIELAYFDAVLNENNDAELNWTTLTEINNDYFIIQKSKDGIVFEDLSKIDGAGNSTQEIDYQYIDSSPYQGITYYRLKQVDFNGDFSFSPIQSVFLNTFEEIYIYPNPSRNFIQIKGLSNASSIQFYNSNGTLVYQKELIDYNNDQQLNISSLTNGLYYINIYQNNQISYKGCFIKN